MHCTIMNGKDTFWDVEGSMAPVEWHHWCHSVTDDPPAKKPPIDGKFTWKTHKFGVSGTP